MSKATTQNTTTDTATIKAIVDLQDVIAKDLGEPAKTYRDHTKHFCPLHPDKNTPSLAVYAATQSWYCYGCGQGGDIFDWLEEYHGMPFIDALKFLERDTLSISPAELAELAAEKRRQSALKKQLARAKRENAAKLLAEAEELERWADSLLDDAQALDFLAGKGVSPGTAAVFGLGIKRDFYLGAAITIPWRVDGEIIRNIQYRVIGGTDDRRYRWDTRGSPVSIFNRDIVAGDKSPLVVVEGAIKAMVMCQHGFQAVAIRNQTGWQSSWADHFRHRPIYVALDPDAKAEARQIVRNIGGNARLVRLPAKPDDLIVQHGWTAEGFRALMEQAEMVD